MRFPTTIHVARMGPVDQDAIMLAVGSANACQSEFHFDALYHEPGEFDFEPFHLPNGAYDLDEAFSALDAKSKFERPLVIFTDFGYGTGDAPSDPEELGFSGVLDGALIVSTRLWKRLFPGRSLQPYLLQQLATSILTLLPDMEYHSETRGCPLDYCDAPEEIDTSVHTGDLCSRCLAGLAVEVERGAFSWGDLAAVRKVLHLARGRSRAFVAMPFAHEFDRVFSEGIRPALEAAGYEVIRGDTVGHPRLITDAIDLEIRSAELVVADLSGGNPNVFYEVGLAHAIGVDTLLLTHNKEHLPFDVHARRTVFYDPDRLDELQDGIRRLLA